MPELPEVETTRRGIERLVRRRVITAVTIRRGDLRFPVSADLGEITGCRIGEVRRRSKYLLMDVSDGSTILLHLGMSGSLRVVPLAAEWRKHDHIGISLSGGKQLRFHDPRRFGLVLRLHGPPEEHPLLRNLGPEPLDDAFTTEVLRKQLSRRVTPIKLALMDAKTVVGVGNIYASEALFRAGIRPSVSSAKLSKPRVAKLVEAIRAVLTESIEAGGTTLRDFVGSSGEPGYFKQHLFVYGRKDEPCLICGTPVRHAVVGGRSTYWCQKCQR
ncbi:MAG: bifunctional DNA-formamidopyrimidine glycosylase/DNA-(apurinic or apyrimidinic site) lyase [Verrucomicrobiota bacterium]